MDDGGCLGGLIGLGIVGYLIYLFIVYVVPLILAAGLIILGVAAGIGAIIGLGLVFKNFSYSVSRVSRRRRALGKYKNEYAALKAINEGRESSNTKLKDYMNEFCNPKYSYTEHEEYKKISDDYVYEQIASKSYFLGPCFYDLGQIIKGAFEENYSSTPDFSKGDNWATRILYVILAIFQLIVIYVLGTIFTLAMSGVIAVVFGVFEIFFLIFAGIVLLIETIYYKSRKISYRCPACKHEYSVPVYICPNYECNCEHVRLRPGAYGIFKRKCLCGAKIPLTVKLKGKYLERDKERAMSFTKVKFKMADMKSLCPICKAEHNAGLSKPTSIALIGGKSAGKTTFKVAFSYSFLDDEIIKTGMDYNFPDQQSEEEYDRSIRYYKGMDIIPGTNRGIDNDIATFSFLLSHGKFSASRMIHIYDMPGEVFESGDAKEGWENYSFSEGMVFLFDPYSLPLVKEYRSRQSEVDLMGICETNMNNLFESLINTLENVRVKKSSDKRFKIPVALTINKVDSPLLKKMCGSEAVEVLMKEVPEVFNDYFFTMDYVCRCFLDRNAGRNFITNLDNSFETVHFFYSSPMGYIPKSSLQRFNPVNVLPIMQWMMLRADKELSKVWQPDNAVVDIDDEKKKLYSEHPEYYDQYIVPLYNEMKVEV